MKARVILVLVAVVVLLTAFCSSDKTTNPEEECPGPTSAENLLKALACSYAAQDLSAYEELLHEQFLFVFTAEVSESLSLPGGSPWWGKTPDVASTANLFADTTVADISFEYVCEEDWFACADVRADTTFSGYCCRICPDMKVEVEEPGEELILLWVNETWLDVTVVPDPYIEGRWVVLRIEETVRPKHRRSVALATRHTAWSQIKAFWKQD